MFQGGVAWLAIALILNASLVSARPDQGTS
jgi:hypothetical protein